MPDIERMTPYLPLNTSNGTSVEELETLLQEKRGCI